MALDRDLLAKVLGMLGSEHAGERAAAAAKADAMVKEAGLTWAQVLSGSPPSRRAPTPEEYSDLMKAMRRAYATEQARKDEADLRKAQRAYQDYMEKKSKMTGRRS